MIVFLIRVSVASGVSVLSHGIHGELTDDDMASLEHTFALGVENSEELKQLGIGTFLIEREKKEVRPAWSGNKSTTRRVKLVRDNN